MRRYRIEHTADGWHVLGEPPMPSGHDTRGACPRGPWVPIKTLHDRQDAERYVATVQARQLVLLGMDPRTGRMAA